jgi:hypothetical protein
VSDAKPDAGQGEQKVVCSRFGTAYVESPSYLKAGVDPQVREGITPLNGLRHRPEGDTTAWYIWAGETLSGDPSFFQPVHVSHLAEWCPAVIPYLGLPPGWRFLVAPGQENVWFDETLNASES